MKTKYIHVFFGVYRGLSIHGVGVSRDTVFQEIRLGAGFETGDFVKEKSRGGYDTVERLGGGTLFFTTGSELLARTSRVTVLL